MPAYFKQKGPRLISRGYAIIPIPTGSKGPVVPNWREVAPRTASEFEVFVTGTHEVEVKGEMVQRKNVREADGLGIVTDWTPAIDIDCTSKDAAEHMEQFVRDHCDDAPLRIGQAPKRLLMYRTDKPFPKVISAYFIDPEDTKRKKQRIEVLGQGQQFVAYHIHPDTGLPYVWPEDWENPCDVDASDLPLITSDHARAVCREFERWAREQGWEQVGEVNDSSSSPGAAELLAAEAPPAESDSEVARVKSALEAISPDCSRDEYIVTLAALKWTGWLCAEELAREWAEGSKEGKFDESDFERDWKSLKGEKGAKSTRLASLYGMAKKAGWDASRKGENELTEEESAELFDGLMAEIAELDPADRAGRRALVSRIGESKLDAIDIGDLLRALAKRTKVSIRDLKTALKDVKQESREHGEPTHANYAKKLLTDIEDRIGTEARGVEGKLWVYSKKDGVWIGRAPEQVAIDVARTFDGMDGCSRVSDYNGIAKHAVITAAEGNEKFFEDAPIGMACEGRFYGIEDGEIKREPIASGHRQRVLTPVSPKVGPTPLWDALMERAFDGDHEREQEMLLEEFFGGMLLGLTPKFEKALLMKGVGRAGKGTILKVISALVPKSFQCSVPPDRWNEPYYLANLAGRRLNLVGELSEDNPIDSAVFKSVLGRDELSGREPGQSVFQFTNSATHIFNANFFVPTRDHTEAFYSRWILVDFRNSMLDTAERAKQIDVNLAAKIIASELPGLAARFLKAAKRLLERGHFPTTRAHTILMGQWQHRASSLLEFLCDRDTLVVGDAERMRMPRAVFYNAYSAWCRESNRKPISKQKLYDELDRSKEVAAMGIKTVKKSTGNAMMCGVTMRNTMFEVEQDDDEL